MKFHNLTKIFTFTTVVLFWKLHTSVEKQQNFTHTTATLSQNRSNLAATSSGELVFFGGGWNITAVVDQVDIYNVTSGSWTTATLSVPRAELTATSSGNLVFFAGGWDETTTTYNQVDIYNVSSGNWSTATLTQARYGLAATSVGDLVLFGGGYNSTYASNVVDIYNVINNTWTTAYLNQARRYLAATSVANRYALFGGGDDGMYASNVVDVYDSFSGVWITTTFSLQRTELATASHGNLVFFGGGQNNGGSASTVVDIFDPTTQIWSTAMLSQARWELAATSAGEVVAFGGGLPDSFIPSPVVDLYNVTSGSWMTMNLVEGRYNLAAVSSLNKIFFGGGFASSGYSNVVDILDVPSAPYTPIQTPTSNAQPVPSSSLTTMSPSNIPSTPTSPFATTISPSVSNFSIAPTLSSTSQMNSTELTNGTNTFTSGVIAAIVIVVVVPISVGIILFLVILIRKRKQTKKKPKKDTPTQQQHTVAQSNERSLVYLEPSEYSTKQQTESENTQQSRLLISTTSSISTATKYSQVPFKELIVEKEIGEGGYGKVCLGKWNAAPVALKFCKKKGKLDEFMKEVKLMIELPSHPNVVQMFGVSLDGPQPVIILEYCTGGSLDKLLFDTDENLLEDYKIKLVRGIAAGMLHLHKHNIIHRDLASRNILLTESGHPKISDFGMSRILEGSSEGKTYNNIGPLRWMAPESLKHQTYSKKSDVWSFGIVVYEIVAQCEPHIDVDPLDIGPLIRDQYLTPEIPSDAPQKLHEFMKMCWNQQPEQRPDFENICAMLEEEQNIV